MLKLDIIGQAHTVETDGAIRPTILIGLGGAGKEVLMRLRRLFHEKHGVVGLPVMQYLWFDTDMRPVNIKGEAYDEIHRQLYLNEDETVNGRVEPAALAAYYQEPEKYPHIFRWLNPEALEVLGTTIFAQGTRQIRPLGRLAFFHSYPVLRAAIEHKLAAIGADAQQMTREMGHAVSSEVEIVIIASLAGGAGSGSFIDMACLAREIAPQAMVTGLFFLPQVFEGNIAIPQEAIRANGYAALKELDYYCSHSNYAKEGQPPCFDPAWDNTPHPMTDSPFTSVYLIDNTTYLGIKGARGRVPTPASLPRGDWGTGYGGARKATPNSELLYGRRAQSPYELRTLNTDDYTDVFQMAAEFLMLDFEDSAFAAAKRGHRARMVRFLSTETRYEIRDAEDKPVYVHYFPNRYSAFGLSQIALNQPQIALAAAYKLADDMIGFWLVGAESSPPLHGGESVDLEPRLDALSLTLDGLVSDLLMQAFGETDRQAIENQFHAIAVKITQKEREIKENLGAYEKIPSRRRHLQAYFQSLNRMAAELEAFAAEIQVETESLVAKLKNLFELNLREEGTIGPHIKVLQENKAHKEQRLQTCLEEIVIQFLAQPAVWGKTCVDRFLDAVEEAVEQLIKQVEEQVEGASTDAPTQTTPSATLARRENANLLTPNSEPDYEVTPKATPNWDAEIESLGYAWDKFEKYRPYLEEAWRIPIWAGFLFAWRARSMATAYYEGRLRDAIEAYFHRNLAALKSNVNAQKEALKTTIENRYRLAALKRLANPQGTGVLNRLRAYLGVYTAHINKDGSRTTKATGLRGAIELFAANLTALSYYFRRQFDSRLEFGGVPLQPTPVYGHPSQEGTFGRPSEEGLGEVGSLNLSSMDRASSTPSSSPLVRGRTVRSAERNFHIPLNIDYRSEIQAFLAPRLGVSDMTELLTQVSNQYFMMSGLSPALAHPRKQPTAVDVAREGFREIYRRSLKRDAEPVEWEHIRHSLEALVIDMMKDFRASDTALHQLYVYHNNDETAIAQTLEGQIKTGSLRMQAGKLSLSEFTGARRLAMIGVSDTEHTVCGVIPRLLSGEYPPLHPSEEGMGTGRTPNWDDDNPYAHATALRHKNDAIVFFTEQLAFPIVYVGGLQTLRDSCAANLRSNRNHPYWRHIERDYRKYRDIIPPLDTEEVLRLIERHTLVIASIVLGHVSFAPEETAFYFTNEQRGIQRRNYLSSTIHASAQTLCANAEMSQQLARKNESVYEQWNRNQRIDKLFQLLRIYKDIVETVYLNNIRTTILGETFPIDQVSHIAGWRLYEQQWNTVKQATGWEDGRISDELASYDALDEFTTTLDFQEAEMQGRLRALRSLDK